MSLIPGLGNLGPIGKLLDPGALVKDVVNGVLPKNMGVVGDLAGAVVDFKMGNPIGGVQHAMEALKDLPQATKGAPQQQGAATGSLASNLAKLPNLEPSPPPAASKPLDMNALLAALKQLTDILSGKQPDGAKTDNAKNATSEPAPPDSPSKAADTAAKAATATPNTTLATTTTTTTATTTNTPMFTRVAERAEPRPSDSASHGRGPDAGETASWVGTPRTPAPTSWMGTPRTPVPAASAAPPAPSTAAPAPSSPATTPAAAANPSAATPTASSAPAASSASAVSSTAASGGETITSMAQFNTMGDSAIRDAVIHGRISPELAKDQTAMMAIQQRMNAISEMNNLMTAMMRALHDMQMAVIQNIRI